MCTVKVHTEQLKKFIEMLTIILWGVRMETPSQRFCGILDEINISSTWGPAFQKSVFPGK
jgi:hypothetical protein